MSQINLYDLLGVKPDAEESDIKRAYRKKAQKTHPDIAGPDMASLFMGIQQAYETLSDPDKRALYDESLKTAQRPPEQPRESGPDEPRQGAHAGQAPHTETATEDRPEPSYDDWQWTQRIAIPVRGGRNNGTVPAGKRVIRERYTQSFPFLIIFGGSVLFWLITLSARQGLPVVAQYLSTPAAALFAAAQVLHIGAVLAACLSKRYTGLKALIASLAALVFLLVPTAASYMTTKAAAFVVPSVPAVIDSVLLVLTGLGVVWSVSEQRRRAAKLREVGIPRKAGGWAVLSLRRSVFESQAERRTQMIAEMVANRLPGTKILKSVPLGGRGSVASMVVINGNRAAIVETMDVGENLPDDITFLNWKEFNWGQSLLAGKPQAAQNVLPNSTSVHSFLAVYPARTGAYTTNYSIDRRHARVSAVSDTELGNLMGKWLSEGEHAGAVNKDLLYTLLTGKRLSSFV